MSSKDMSPDTICDNLNRFVQSAQQRGRLLTIRGWGTTENLGYGFNEAPLTFFKCYSGKNKINFKFVTEGTIGREFSLTPTAHGTDLVSDSSFFSQQRHSRIWVHDGNTLNDLNIVEL